LGGGAEGGEECSCGSALEDRNIDRCSSKGSQLAWMRQLRRIDRSGHSVEIAEDWPKNGDDSRILLKVYPY
jgi:hypothetical protein